MNRIALVLAPALLLLACNVGYGPVQDHSEFKSARLADDGETVLFTYHRFLYRPASGFRAFPDGGIPKYETDINFLGTYNLRTRKLDILHRELNRDWQPGQGNFTIVGVNGDFVLVAQGGQTRGPFAHDLKHILADFRHSTATRLNLKADLARLGRDFGQVYLAAPDGTLVFITPSLQQNQTPNAQRQPGFVPEIWIRTPEGDYSKVAASNHYERTLNGDVIYWLPDTRKFMAYSIGNRTTRVLPGYKTPPSAGDVTEAVILTSDRQGLRYGTKSYGQWSYQPVALDPVNLK